MNTPPSAAEAAGESKYKGVRRRKWGKWVSEIRLPNSRDRIWLGSYDSPEKAARAFDAALYCLRGRHAKFNFPDQPPDILDAHSLTCQQIQEVAAKFANEYSNDAVIVAPPADDHAAAADDSSPVATVDQICHVGASSVKDENYNMDWSNFLNKLDPVDQGGGSGSASNLFNIYSDQFDNMITDELYQTHDPHDDGDYYDDVSGHDSFSHQSFLWNFGNN
ncbi:ethylene-responsive transcription factor ERF017-like [Momordica charantia]|uniref:Ethylene-responsive transcription factor ERF017-like n=1 Tax=Momordica charantia TaxID=3673 RepID=A0A6J1BQ92_MOMCH|nr:ethylene-responsive transcription factor ERF017-like [Momordica charantia]